MKENTRKREEETEKKRGMKEVRKRKRYKEMNAGRKNQEE